MTKNKYKSLNAQICLASAIQKGSLSRSKSDLDAMKKDASLVLRRANKSNTVLN
jgi:hypothetical protein